MSGFRGSKGTDARRYKKAGHQNEDEFGVIFGGSNDGLAPQGKTDWVDKDGNTYTIKSGLNKTTGFWTKHWQIFLYGLGRIKSDKDFMGDPQGKLLANLLESFPSESSGYFADKAKAKEILVTIPKTIKGAERLEEFQKGLKGKANQYFESKNRLRKVTESLSASLESLESRRNFFRKAFFNNNEVSRLAIEEGRNYVIYSREDVVEILAINLSPSISNAGSRFDDLNIPGQKVVFKYQGRNIAELEVRNEESHYREIRFNAHARKIATLLKDNTFSELETPGKRFRKLKR
jgi:hypothetical protein